MFQLWHRIGQLDLVDAWLKLELHEGVQVTGDFSFIPVIRRLPAALDRHFQVGIAGLSLIVYY